MSKKEKKDVKIDWRSFEDFEIDDFNGPQKEFKNFDKIFNNDFVEGSSKYDVIDNERDAIHNLKNENFCYWLDDSVNFKIDFGIDVEELFKILDEYVNRIKTKENKISKILNSSFKNGQYRLLKENYFIIFYSFRKFLLKRVQSEMVVFIVLSEYFNFDYSYLFSIINIEERISILKEMIKRKPEIKNFLKSFQNGNIF